MTPAEAARRYAELDALYRRSQHEADALLRAYDRNRGSRLARGNWQRADLEAQRWLRARDTAADALQEAYDAADESYD